MKRHPEARFDFTSVGPIPEAASGSPNHLVSGHLTQRGVTKPVTFPAEIGRSPEEEGSLIGRANFDLPGKHLVNDLVTLDLKIVAR